MFVMDLQIGPKHNTLKGRQVDNKQTNKKNPTKQKRNTKTSRSTKKRSTGNTGRNVRNTGDTAENRTDELTTTTTTEAEVRTEPTKGRGACGETLGTGQRSPGWCDRSEHRQHRWSRKWKVTTRRKRI